MRSTQNLDQRVAHRRGWKISIYSVPGGGKNSTAHVVMETVKPTGSVKTSVALLQPSSVSVHHITTAGLT